MKRAFQANDSLTANSFSYVLLMNNPVEIRAKFLMMYCPTKVGVNQYCQVSPGKTKTGKKVAPMWRINAQKAILVNFGNSQIAPIMHSKIPKEIVNVLNWINLPMVPSKRVSTRLSAGETPITFKIPNQK